MRRAHKLDGNHKTRCEYFKAHGISVCSTAALGDGFPDVVLAYIPTAKVCLCELKTAKGRLTEAQERFLSDFPMTRVCRDDASADAIIRWLKTP